MALVTVLGVGLAGAATLVVRDEEPGPRAVAPSPPAALPPLPDLLPALADAPVPTPDGLAAVVAEALADPALGGSLAASVIDARTREVLLEQRADTPVLPASTVKIATAVAALTALEPAARLRTTVVAGDRPGEVVLVGGGDVLLTVDEDPGLPRPARLADLAAQLDGTLVTRVLVDDALYPGPRLAPGWRPGYVSGGDVAPVSALALDGGRVRPDERAREADPALAAGRALAALLGVEAEVARGSAPAAPAELAAVVSPQVPQLVEVMLTRSDNDLAESLARQVALAQGLPATFAGAAAAVAGVLDGVLQEFGLEPGTVSLADGSGLSRLDRAQPAALSRLLAAVADGRSPRLAPVLTGLPVAAFDGTLEDRFGGQGAQAAAGRVRAKTGTLSGVSALAGLLTTADGRLLAFDLTADAVPPGANRAAERALDRLAARLASCGCRAGAAPGAAPGVPSPR